VLISGIVLGLVLGLIAGGSINNLAAVRLRWIGILFLAVIVRFGTEAAIGAHIEAAQTLRLPLFSLSFGLLLAGLWVNRSNPGLSLAFVGILLNTIAVVANGGYMPIWRPALVQAGFAPDAVLSPFHIIPQSDALNAAFLLRAGPLGDILPIPLPFIRNVASIGDLFLSAGLGFFLFATVLRTPTEAAEVEGLPAEGGRRGWPARGRSGSVAEASVLDRPVVFGGSTAGLSAPTVPGEPNQPGVALAGSAEVAAPRPGAVVVERVRRHPYVRLALNSSFSALWVGQLISLFGDRIHQIAIAFLVLGLTHSPVAVAFVFVAATLPNLLLSPIAGAYVDRWDQKDVLVVSDLLRAAIILLIPIAAVTNLLLVYPLVFGVTSVSIFFRPARVAALPRIVREDELLAANSAMWLGETIADVIGYPLAAFFVAFLGSALPLAFWIDAATYAASAALIFSIAVPPLPHRGDDEERLSVFADMKAGYNFLRNERTLLGNTLQATVAQFTIGVLIALTAVYASDIVLGDETRAKEAYGFLEAAIGVGNLIGGFFIGIFGARFARGKTVIVGYAVWGACIAALGLTGNLPLAIGLMFGSGIANMIFVIPSQTMFQERTPPEMLGRVVGFRFALVFGSMAIAMGVSGLLAAWVGASAVIGVFGLMTMLAGLAGLLVPAVRDA
jgi:DHA3 family macrolide efflux protein-like MFS transporter